MLDPIRTQAAADARPLVVYAVGDRLRVIADSRAGQSAPRIGDVGTVRAVYPKREALVVYHNCVERVYLLDFGPPGEADTWAFADGDVQPADAPSRKGRRKR